MDGEPEDWVRLSLEAAPWVVTRRAAPIAGRIPVGIRGEGREQRRAASVQVDEILEILRPEDLRLRRPPRPHPAFDALAGLTAELDRAGCAWGPVGAAGYELASGRPTLSATSDLDIVLRADRLARSAGLRSLSDAVRDMPVRVDILVETPRGGVTLDELLGGAPQVLVRTSAGPRLFARDQAGALAARAPSQD